MHELTIIVVTWNSAEDIVRCLASVTAEGKGVSVRMIVIDNASTDGTDELVKLRFPGIELIRNPRNVGFASATNQGLRLCTTPYALLLNPDTEVLAGSLRAFLEFMESTPDAWVAGAALVNPDGTPQVYGVRFPSVWNMLCESFFLDRAFPQSRIFGRHKELYENQTRPRRVDFVQGAALCVRMSGVHEVGYLDERFFMYFEEADWCFRMKQAGGSVYVCPPARVIHHGGAPGHYDERRLVHYHRSLAGFTRKHYAVHRQILIGLVVFIRSSVRIFTWLAVWTTRPGLRAAARSSISGYLKVITKAGRSV